MDITFANSDIVEQNEDILIHLFFHIVDYDFRDGFFSNESSIRDMDSCCFKDEDFVELARFYNETCRQNYTYSQGSEYYQKLFSEKFDNIFVERFEKAYGISIDKKTHYLKDIIVLLKDVFPNRNWKNDNIFILKTLDNRADKKDKELSQKPQSNEKVVKFPVRKKLTEQEIRSGFNEFLMTQELGLSWEEARQLVKANFDKKHEGEKFEPYLP